MSISRIVEYIFFFVLLFGAGYMVWQVFAPFAMALALSIIIVTICQPLYDKILKLSYKNNKNIAAATTTLMVVVILVLPIVFLSSLFARELVTFYHNLGTGQELSVEKYSGLIEVFLQKYLPGFDFNLTSQIRDSAEWLLGNIGTIFAGTVSTLLIIVISLFGSFYFFRDGKDFLRILIKISPLSDADDSAIMHRLAGAVRSVVTGVVLLSLIQGVLAGIGFAIFGINQAVLWGAVTAVMAMIPGVGTLVVMAPAVIYLFLTTTTFNTIGLLIWAIVMVGMVDNVLGPHLMSRGNNLHPFIILLSVLGGVSAFGPLGFIIGPVIVTLFMALLEVYNQYLAKDTKRIK